MAEKKQSVSGIVLTRLMKEKGLSNRAAAEIAGVGATSIHDWKTGVAPTDFAALSKLADHLGVQLRYLLTGENEPLVSVDTKNLDAGFFEESKLFTFRGECEITIKKVGSSAEA